MQKYILYLSAHYPTYDLSLVLKEVNTSFRLSGFIIGNFTWNSNKSTFAAIYFRSKLVIGFGSNLVLPDIEVEVEDVSSSDDIGTPSWYIVIS